LVPTPRRSSPRRSFGPAGAAAAAVGILLFGLAVQRAGVGEILEGIRRLGAGFGVVLLCSAVREASRAIAWMLCIEGDRRLAFPDALSARLTGEALGNLTPLGLLVSEPAKAIYVRDRVPLAAGLAGTVIENLVYSLSVIVVVVLGTTALLAAFPTPEGLRRATLASLVGVVIAGIAAAWLVAIRPSMASSTLAWLHGRGLFRRIIATWIERVRDAEHRILGFARRHPRRLVRLLGLDALFHAGGVAEVYAVLWFMGTAPQPTILTAFILETVNRVITIAFKFVPLRLGVDEAATGLVANALGFGTAAGVTLAIVRKARVLFWSGLGILCLARRGLSIGAVMEETKKMVQETERTD
jgi:hypothetical protein